MPIEIERKFLVAGDGWMQQVGARRQLRQGYLSNNGRFTIRVRIDGAEAATLTIKSVASGITRQEYEYAIPVIDAEEMLVQCEGSIIAKVRHIVRAGALSWEIDVFEGDNAGLVVAEVELGSADQQFEHPAWLGAEVTHERRYYNADLARHPFSRWRH